MAFLTVVVKCIFIFDKFIVSLVFTYRQKC